MKKTIIEDTYKWEFIGTAGALVVISVEVEEFALNFGST